MFDIRKIQEQVLYGAVKNESSDETAKRVVLGDDLCLMKIIPRGQVW